MKFYATDFGTIIIRFNLMIAIVVLAFGIGLPLLAILAVPFLMANMMGIDFKNKNQSIKTTAPANHINMHMIETKAA